MSKEMVSTSIYNTPQSAFSTSGFSTVRWGVHGYNTSHNHHLSKGITLGTLENLTDLFNYGVNFLISANPGALERIWGLNSGWCWWHGAKPRTRLLQVWVVTPFIPLQAHRVKHRPGPHLNLSYTPGKCNGGCFPHQAGETLNVLRRRRISRSHKVLLRP